MKIAFESLMIKGYDSISMIFIRSSVCLGADYTPNDEDEVEDLHDLIVAARDKVPFDAVCSGAILSDYQGRNISCQFTSSDTQAHPGR